MQQRVPISAKTIRASEIAAGLGIHVNTVWKWTRKGRLPKPTKISAHITAWNRAEIVALFPVLGGQEG
jgi:predicted DNA-binding transcriptional regulator AlpA